MLQTFTKSFVSNLALFWQVLLRGSACSQRALLTSLSRLAPSELILAYQFLHFPQWLWVWGTSVTWCFFFFPSHPEIFGTFQEQRWELEKFRLDDNAYYLKGSILRPPRTESWIHLNKKWVNPSHWPIFISLFFKTCIQKHILTMSPDYSINKWESKFHNCYKSL